MEGATLEVGIRRRNYPRGGNSLEVGDSGRYPRGGRFWRIRVEYSYEQEGWNDN